MGQVLSPSAERQAGYDPVFKPDGGGAKSFDKAYDNLIKKFKNTYGANMLIPEEDLAVHQYILEN